MASVTSALATGYTSMHAQEGVQQQPLHGEIVQLAVVSRIPRERTSRIYYCAVDHDLMLHLACITSPTSQLQNAGGYVLYPLSRNPSKTLLGSSPLGSRAAVFRSCDLFVVALKSGYQPLLPVAGKEAALGSAAQRFAGSSST